MISVISKVLQQQNNQNPQRHNDYFSQARYNNKGAVREENELHYN